MTLRSDRGSLYLQELSGRQVRRSPWPPLPSLIDSPAKMSPLRHRSDGDDPLLKTLRWAPRLLKQNPKSLIQPNGFSTRPLPAPTILPLWEPALLLHAPPWAFSRGPEREGLVPAHRRPFAQAALSIASPRPPPWSGFLLLLFSPGRGVSSGSWGFASSLSPSFKCQLHKPGPFCSPSPDASASGCSTSVY